MSRRIRHHVNPLSLHNLGTDEPLLDVPGNLPVEVDLGCAEGSFLFNRAQEDPDRFYLGLEIRRPLVDSVNDRAVKEGFRQIRAVHVNLLSDPDRLFSQGSVDIFHMLFPDPWFKKRHKKRRFFNSELANQLSMVIKVGGLFHFASDIFDLALESMALMESMCPLFSNCQGEWRFAEKSPFLSMSKRETLCLRLQIPVWRLLYVRSAS